MALAVTGNQWRRTNFALRYATVVATRNDRFAVQIALDITGHLLGGTIPALGLLAHGHQNDVVQVTLQVTPQTFGVRGAGLRRCQPACARIVRSYRVTRWRRVLFAKLRARFSQAH